MRWATHALSARGVVVQWLREDRDSKRRNSHAPRRRLNTLFGTNCMLVDSCRWRTLSVACPLDIGAVTAPRAVRYLQDEESTYSIGLIRRRVCCAQDGLPVFRIGQKLTGVGTRIVDCEGW